jgi:hypothetical protein
MQSLRPSCLALQTVEHYVLYPTLSCSACYTPGHACQFKDIIIIIEFSEYFYKYHCILLQQNNIRVADILDITVLDIVMLISHQQVLIYN